MRTLSEIVNEIRKDWSNVNFAAKPYLNAMATLSSIDDMYMFETGREQVARFLCNAGSWRGDVARKVKKELNKMLK